MESEKGKNNTPNSESKYKIFAALIALASAFVLLLINIITLKIKTIELDTLKNEQEKIYTGFSITKKNTNEKEYDICYLMHNNSNLPVVAIGLQPMLRITYDGHYIINIRLNDVYSNNSYIFDTDTESFILKKKSESGYSTFKKELENYIVSSLKDKNISSDKLCIEELTCCCVISNNSAENEDQYLLIKENTATEDITDIDKKYYTSGVNYTHSQAEIVNATNPEFMQLVNKILTRITKLL